MIWSREICDVSENKCILKFCMKKSMNIKSYDVYIGEKDFLFASNNFVKRFYCPQKFDRVNIKCLDIKFDSKSKEFSCELPCYSDDECKDGFINCSGKSRHIEPPETDQSIVKLVRLTDSCKFYCDGEEVKVEEKYFYGYGNQFSDDTSLVEENLQLICKIANPSHTSPIMRTICREKHELKDFCQDQYKLNFVELQVPEGFENPMKFTFNYDDHKLSANEQYILDNIKKKRYPAAQDNQAEIDCGLVSILLAICYDLRTTNGEPTCESGWTRTMLSPVLTYFESLPNLRTVLEIFVRRCLIYPLYRNYELTRMCIDDAVEALQKGPDWLIKQFLLTYDLFKTSGDSRQLLNQYYIEPYIDYISSTIDKEYLHTLSRNLKNVSLDVNKKRIRLNLTEIEADMLRELIEDMHLANSSDSDDRSSVESSESEGNSDSEENQSLENDDKQK